MTVLRIYDPEVDDFRDDGYPVAWAVGDPAIKDLVRAEAGNRCVRCGHPYAKGAGEWSPCDERCAHDGPIRWRDGDGPTREQRAKALRQIPEKLEIEFAKIHQRVEELVGRPVFTHEMGTSGMAYLEHEILTGHVPSLGGVLAKIPDDKSVIVVSTEADDA